MNIFRPAFCASLNSLYVCTCQQKKNIQKKYECNQFTAKWQYVSSPVESQYFTCGGEEGVNLVSPTSVVYFIFAGVRRCLQESGLADVIILKLFFIKVSVNLQLNFDLLVVSL